MRLRGVGMVELLCDEQHNFYFLEMNTRLQVEYPVTEMISGVDIIKQQVKVPQGEEIRVDEGYEEGMDIPICYNLMLAKIIAYGKDRHEAIQLMQNAISDYKIDGIKTTLPFGQLVMRQKAFKSGVTHFVALNDLIALQRIRKLLNYIPQNNCEKPKKLLYELENEECSNLDSIIPENNNAALRHESCYQRIGG